MGSCGGYGVCARFLVVIGDSRFFILFVWADCSGWYHFIPFIRCVKVPLPKVIVEVRLGMLS